MFLGFVITLLSELVCSPSSSFYRHNFTVFSPWRAQCQALPGYGVQDGVATACPVGTFKTRYGDRRCSDCPIGLVTSSRGSSSPKACVAPAGHTYVMSSGALKQCSPGTAKSVPGKHACDPCDAGTFAPSAGATACEICPKGSFCTRGAAAKALCAAGTFLPYSGGQDEDDCKPCDAGTFAPRGGATTCEICPKGSFCTRGAVTSTLCPTGEQTLGPGSKRCLCTAGRFRTGDGQCVSCPASTYRSEFEGEVTCNLCPKRAPLSYSGTTSVNGCYPTVVQTIDKQLGAFMASLGSALKGQVQHLVDLVAWLFKSLAEYSKAYEYSTENQTGGFEERAEGCPWQNGHELSDWFSQQQSEFHELQATLLCSVTRRLARKILVRYHPDKFVHHYPECGPGLAFELVQQLNNRLDRCRHQSA